MKDEITGFYRSETKWYTPHFTEDEIDISQFQAQRYIREQLSQQRKLGNIYIPVGQYVYRRIELCAAEQVESYIRSQVAHLRTQYFNTLKPLRNYAQSEQVAELYGKLGVFDEL